MPVNSEDGTSRATKLCYPLSRCRIGLDKLCFTSTRTVGKPGRVIRRNVQCFERFVCICAPLK